MGKVKNKKESNLLKKGKMKNNGNYALALMITVCSNVLGVLTVPFALKLILEGVVSGISINAEELLIKLLLTILLPLLIGKGVQMASKRVQEFGKQYKTELSLINNGSLVMIVWQTISSSQDSIIDTRFTSILLLIASGILLHFVYLTINYGVVKLGRFDVPERRAVLLLASQKTLPVSVTIISYFSADVGDQGLITLPCIIGHLVQLFIDSYIVSRWNASDDKLTEQENVDLQKSDVGKTEFQNLGEGQDGQVFGQSQGLRSIELKALEEGESFGSKEEDDDKEQSG
eukprot:TRINITY_DN5804_c0_g1_i1.p1 TRINITY_DN5804_c0_g1~~TRINITY_DN5804_c0_g1_i1.p1  ORF type:complete len:288 (-),score=33.26 TRINITY_DN5804_c0_g1_i1:685-1548(-)